MSKLFPKECKYSGELTDLIRWRFEIVISACHPCGVKTTCRQVMSLLRPIMFLCGPALVDIMEAVLNKTKSPENVLKCLKDHVLDGRAKKVNDEEWLYRTFELVKAKTCSMYEDVTYE